ncbi:hypothetical protein ACFSC9_03275 [Paenibacillus wenxiniae]|uniref:ATP-grasp domain-containing protein n=1 Tax=Paenibacillus wenxiniae TaxID=1636843 RepID=A0ABW4REC5_9BACL
MITKQQAKRILVTGGRAPVALEWCRLLHAAGHEVYVAESFPQPLCRYSNTVRRCYVVPAPRQQPGAFLQELQRIVEKERIDVLLPTCEEIFHIAAGQEHLSAEVQVISPTIAQLHRLHHKGDFIKLVRAAGLAVPETVLLEDAQQWEQTQRCAWEKGTAIVLKPAYSRFASQVWLPPQLARQVGLGSKRETASQLDLETKLESASESKQKRELKSEPELEPESESQFEPISQLHPNLDTPSQFQFEQALDVKLKVESELERVTETEREQQSFYAVSSAKRSAAIHSEIRSNGAKRNSFNAPAPDTLSQQQPWIAQQFIPGEQLCTYSIVHEGIVVAHATYRCRYRNSRAGASVHFEALDRPDTLTWVQTLVNRWSNLEDSKLQQDVWRKVQYSTEQNTWRAEACGAEQNTRRAEECGAEQNTWRAEACGTEQNTRRAEECGAEQNTWRAEACGTEQNTRRAEEYGVEQDTRRAEACGTEQDTWRAKECGVEQDTRRAEQPNLQHDTRVNEDKCLFHRFSGQLSFDLMEQQHTGMLYPLECNPRATSGVHLFQPEDGLEQALLHPAQLVATATVIQPQPGRRVMLTLPMLVSGFGRRWSRQQWRGWRQALRGAEDAVYRRHDRLPAYGQLRLLWCAWRMSRRERISIVEALTYDIEWNGIDAGAEGGQL